MRCVVVRDEVGKGQMMARNWRQEARQVILSVMDECNGADVDAAGMRKLANMRYPFGIRKYTPYKIWLEELSTLIPKEQTPATKERIRNFWIT